MTIPPEVAAVFSAYPEDSRNKLLFLRQLILETAASLEITDLEETLKWGEPSYLTRHGSTIRINQIRSSDHKTDHKTDKVAIYFHCKTTLVETFRELYFDLFRFDGNRAIIFSINDDIPVEALKHCIALSLTYHKIKHLPMLGA